MSDPVQLAIIAAITALVGGLPATIAAYSALQQGKKNGIKADEAATAATEASKGAAEVKEHVAAIEVKVDGRLSQLLEALQAKTLLEVKLAAAAGFDQGQQRAELTAQVQAAEVATARQLPPLEHAPASIHQVDRIEKTGDDTNMRVQKVEVKLEDKKDK